MFLENFRDRSEHRVDPSEHILQQMTPRDRREAQQRQESDRQRDARTTQLPNVQIIDHSQINVAAYDLNRDGVVEQSELQRSIRNPQAMSGHNADLGAIALNDRFSEVSRLTSGDRRGVISRGDATALAHLPEDDQLAVRMDYMIQHASRIGRDAQGRPEALFGPRDRVVPDAVDQGRLGDCTLLATLASMASNETGRRYIRNMIHSAGDGFRVNFGNGQEVMTRRPSMTDMGMYAQDSGHGIWPNTIELAYGLSHARHDRLAPQHSSASQMPRQVAEVLFDPNRTRYTEVHTARTTDASLDQELRMRSERLIGMVAVSRRDVYGRADYVDRQGRALGPNANERIAPNHAYAIDHYDPAGRLVYLRNPWDASRLMQMSVRSFRQQFDYVAAINERP